MGRYTMFLDWKNEYYENNSKYYPKQSTDSVQSLSNYQWYFYRTKTNNFTIYMETQKILNSQSNLEKEEWSWRNQPSCLIIFNRKFQIVPFWVSFCTSCLLRNLSTSSKLCNLLVSLVPGILLISTVISPLSLGCYVFELSLSFWSI